MKNVLLPDFCLEIIKSKFSKLYYTHFLQYEHYGQVSLFFKKSNFFYLHYLLLLFIEMQCLQEGVYSGAKSHLKERLCYLNYFYIKERDQIVFYLYPLSDKRNFILDADRLKN